MTRYFQGKYNNAYVNKMRKLGIEAIEEEAQKENEEISDDVS